jgi:hypothetical protein
MLLLPTLVLIPSLAWAANPAIPPQTYKCAVKNTVSMSNTGAFAHKTGYGALSPNFGKGRVLIKFKNSPPLLFPDPGDGSPCSGDEPLCLVPFVQVPPVGPFLEGYVVLQPEMLGGLAAFTTIDAAFAFPPGHSITFLPGACYLAGTPGPALTTMAAGPNSCMGLAYGWLPGVLPPGGLYTIPFP